MNYPALCALVSVGVMLLAIVYSIATSTLDAHGSRKAVIRAYVARALQDARRHYIKAQREKKRSLRHMHAGHASALAHSALNLSRQQGLPPDTGAPEVSNMHDLVSAVDGFVATRCSTMST